MYKKMNLILAAAIWLSFCLGLGSRTAHAEAGWELVFQDDFNGTTLNTDNWDIYNGAGHGGNGVRTPDAVDVSNGILTITAQMVNGILASGGIANKKDYPYGKFEFRVRTDPDPSSVTSGVVLTWPDSENWPTDGENDIYETGTGAARSNFHTFIHWGENGKNKQIDYQHNVDATEWHTVAMEWEAGSIRVYVDGNLNYTTTNLTAIPDNPHHLCIQLDATQPTMSGSVRLQVDYVKIYQDTNRISNGLFESGNLAYWSGYGIRTVDGSSAYQGLYGLNLNMNAGVEQVIENLAPNTTYTLSAYMKTQNSSGVLRLGVQNYAGTGTETSVTTSSTSYTYKSLTFTTGADVTSAKVYLYRNGTGSGNGYADRVWLIKN